MFQRYPMLIIVLDLDLIQEKVLYQITMVSKQLIRIISLKVKSFSEFKRKTLRRLCHLLIPKTFIRKRKGIDNGVIKGGGEYQDHWAFEKVKESKPPKIDNNNKSDNPIDAFIFNRLNEVGLSPMNEAGKEILIRRGN